MIVASIYFQKPSVRTDYVVQRGLPSPDAYNPPWEKQVFVAVMDTRGNYHTANAVGDTGNGHNVFMDRDGNIYSGVGFLGADSDKPYGIADVTLKEGAWGGHASLVKYRWTGKFPLATLKAPARYEVVKTREGSLWTLPHALPGFSAGCTCFNNRHAMDYWARTWIGASHLLSVLVVDANGNLVARIGRYGNVDDADPACGRIHFGWLRAVAVSDNALYVCDRPNRRIVKAALKYAVEETVPLP
jgi:hypothetical protein